MNKANKQSFDNWLENYFGEYDASKIRELEKRGEKNPEAFWCKAMAIRYINLLAGMGETKEVENVADFLSQISASPKS